GWAYVWAFVRSAAPLTILVVVVVAVPLVIWRQAHVGREGILLLTLVAAQFAVVVAAGGDWMPAWRLVAPVVPLIVIFAADHWVANAPALPLEWVGTGAIACLVAGLLIRGAVQDPNMVTRVRVWSDQVAALADQGRWLRDRVPHATIATF